MPCRYKYILSLDFSWLSPKLCHRYQPFHNDHFIRYDHFNLIPNNKPPTHHNRQNALHLHDRSGLRPRCLCIRRLGRSTIILQHHRTNLPSQRHLDRLPKPKRHWCWWLKRHSFRGQRQQTLDRCCRSRGCWRSRHGESSRQPLMQPTRTNDFQGTLSDRLHLVAFGHCLAE